MFWKKKVEASTKPEIKSSLKPKTKLAFEEQEFDVGSIDVCYRVLDSQGKTENITCTHYGRVEQNYADSLIDKGFRETTVREARAGDVVVHSAREEASSYAYSILQYNEQPPHRNDTQNPTIFLFGRATKANVILESAKSYKIKFRVGKVVPNE